MRRVLVAVAAAVLLIIGAAAVWHRATSPAVADAAVVLVPSAATWRYLDTGMPPARTWTEPTFDDSAWRSGPAPLGYGDEGVASQVRAGRDARKRVATYLRTTFVAEPEQLTMATLSLRRDDGAVAYVNGVEVARSNMPTGTVGHATLAAREASDDGAEWHRFGVPMQVLRSGENVLAVEVHQFRRTSSDLVFDAELIASTAPPTRVYAVGDIGVCGSPGVPAVAALFESRPEPLVVVGDLAYENGSAADFEACYDPSFGPYRERTWPVPGNHEYHTPEAAGYFAYFGSRVGDHREPYYALDFGSWRLLMLNSNCAEVACDPDSEQYRWVQRELESATPRCLAAVWHHPLYSSGEKATPLMRPIWQLLQQGGVDLVLTGHDHRYERFAPMDAEGARTDAGIRQFIVGTGGAPLYRATSVAPGSEAQNDSSWGALQLDLGDEGYAWSFVPVAGADYADWGADTC